MRQWIKINAPKCLHCLTNFVVYPTKSYCIRWTLPLSTSPFISFHFYLRGIETIHGNFYPYIIPSQRKHQAFPIFYVDGKLLDAAIESITTNARTGNIGDGKIFVSNIEKAIRIRTGEEDEKAV